MPRRDRPDVATAAARGLCQPRMPGARQARRAAVGADHLQPHPGRRRQDLAHHPAADRHHRQPHPVRRLAAGQGKGRGRRRRAQHLPGQHEPRDPHADERHHRLLRDPAGHPAGRHPAALCGDCLPLGALHAAPAQRHPGHRQAGQGRGAVGGRGLRGGRRLPPGGRHPAHPGGKEGAAPAAGHPAAGAGLPARRCAAHPAGADQPDG
ncbi:Uncharacterised protein [Comamonas aquatica]|uniref:Uncharacterized protein n=1 Tax=Comamonas aquatica TaxID=225991 RepID=A0AA35D4F4_9BURK|nr:Uncharacterised protein [Comamonas aquatica]